MTQVSENSLIMTDKTTLISNIEKSAIQISKIKVKEGASLYEGKIILFYHTDFNSKSKKKTKQLKAKDAGVLGSVLVKEQDVVEPGKGLYTYKSGCSHSTVINDLCAECGIDLQKDEKGPLAGGGASVPMVHTIPSLKVSHEQAQILGRADETRLIEDRKLVLLVDLDQTLIHTTNDNIPPNIKDIHHFQLNGPRSPWYHTRLRPGTHQFLASISKWYELHICTFGSRNYAHQIAHFLDAQGKYFSSRILSRDECFDFHSKTANLKALFPCGDNMVCIIDDREDVWNYALNLIHVKPYHFFRHTGDINAPPGLNKSDNDTLEEGYTIAQLAKGVSIKKSNAKPSSSSSNSNSVPNEGERKKRKREELKEEEEEEGGEGLHWSPIAVNLLLNLRFQRNQAFSLPHSQIKKAELWNDISAEMRKNNFNVPGHVCDLKYRSLLRHYRQKKDKIDQGASTNSWIHFDLMDAYLGDKDSKTVNSQALESKSSASSALYTLIHDTVEDESQGSSSALKEGKDGFQWTPDAIKLFLNLRFDRQRQFLDPMTKKFKLWEDIGKEMQKNGYNISGFGCDCKFRNLLTTYRTVKRKIGDGDQFVRWRYFEIFDVHYKNEPFPNKSNSVTPIKRVSVNHVGNTSDQQDDEEEEDEDEGQYQRKKPKMTINRYLQHKMKAEEKKRKDFLALEERKLKLEYKKLEIEQKKIEVFKSLVAALKQGKKTS
uniref:RNA polymerase II subunit A C-terminal domain phosphatase n=1 Tax=Cacopsylla melanoneura TaxID=428564 RepID=A0A8D9DWL9_9HEMI